MLVYCYLLKRIQTVLLVQLYGDSLCHGVLAKPFVINAKIHHLIAAVLIFSGIITRHKSILERLRSGVFCVELRLRDKQAGYFNLATIINIVKRRIHYSDQSKEIVEVSCQKCPCERDHKLVF